MRLYCKDAFINPTQSTLHLFKTKDIVLCEAIVRMRYSSIINPLLLLTKDNVIYRHYTGCFYHWASPNNVKEWKTQVRLG